MFRSFHAFWSRLVGADIVDWLFGLLFAVVGAAVAVWVYVAFIDDDLGSFKAVSFVAPAVIEGTDGVAPSVDGLPAPSVESSDMVPVTLTRVIDCSGFECPGGGMPLRVSVVWEEVDAERVTIKSFLVAENVPVVYEDGVDYIRGQLLVTRNRLAPFRVPPVVLDYIESEGKTVSDWRISGVNVVMGGIQEAAWSTEVIHVRHVPAEGGE